MYVSRWDKFFRSNGKRPPDGNLVCKTPVFCAGSFQLRGNVEIPITFPTPVARRRKGIHNTVKMPISTLMPPAPLPKTGEGS